VLLFAVSTTGDRVPDASAAEDHVKVYLSEVRELLEDDVAVEGSGKKDLACWSGVAGRGEDSNGWWVGVCEDALDYCGGAPVMVAKEHSGEKVAPAVDFSRSGGGYAAVKARCMMFDEAEEDLDAAVAEAFERLPLPVPVVVSEPEDLSLVNLENYVRGVVDDFDTTVELLDQQVRITAYPTVWSWDMGDGTTYERTAGFGGFPDGGVLHPFYRVGEYDMSVTVTWAGYYQVEDSNVWLPVNGQGYTTSEPEHL